MPSTIKDCKIHFNEQQDDGRLSLADLAAKKLPWWLWLVLGIGIAAPLRFTIHLH